MKSTAGMLKLCYSCVISMSRVKCKRCWSEQRTLQAVGLSRCAGCGETDAPTHSQHPSAGCSLRFCHPCDCMFAQDTGVTLWGGARCGSSALPPGAWFLARRRAKHGAPGVDYSARARGCMHWASRRAQPACHAKRRCWQVLADVPSCERRRAVEGGVRVVATAAHQRYCTATCA